MNSLLFFILIIPLSFLVPILITTFHEAGHAIAAYFITKEKVVVYLGSYRDKQSSKMILLGKFEIWVRINILKWKGGLCVPNFNKCSPKQKIIIILAGPAASFLLFILLLVIILTIHPERQAAVYLIMFCIFAGITFIFNLVPRNKVIYMYQGDMVYNDGTQLKMMLQSKRMPKEYHDALEHLNAKRYSESAALLDGIIENGTKNESVYRCAVYAHIQSKNYQIADDIQQEQLSKFGKLNSTDYVNMALLETLLGRYDEAISYYEHLIETGEGNKYNLINFGYTLILVERFEDAIIYLNKAISIDENFAEAYTNRAYARIKLGMLEEGREDNDFSLTLDDSNSYAYRNSGIYFFEKGQYAEAAQQLNKAKEPNFKTPLLEADMLIVDDYLRRANKMLEQ